MAQPIKIYPDLKLIKVIFHIVGDEKIYDGSRVKLGKLAKHDYYY
jgi:hypothetical protein